MSVFESGDMRKLLKIGDSHIFRREASW